MSDEQIQRFDVLLENIEAKVTTIGEGHEELVQRLDRVETKVDTGFESIEKRLNRIEHHVGLNGVPATRKRSPRKPNRRLATKKGESLWS